MKLEELQADARISGLVGDQIVTIERVKKIGDDAFLLIYRDAASNIAQQLVDRSVEPQLELATNGRPWGFDAPGKEFRLALEAWRIEQAHLFDPMMAVHTSNVEPLPHQIAAVYQEMLPRQPLRYVLADDPGAGKTIMAGLYIRELIMRSAAHRILIVSPGSLTEQWQDELLDKFGLHFEIFSREKQEGSATGNLFDEQPYLICRLDQISRNDDYIQKLTATEWDLAIVDEAHKLSASQYGKEVKRTKRFELGERLGEISRNLLLLTATPHNGKEEDFQIWLSLLDPDRFFGRSRGTVRRVDVSDVMRRMVKEELLKFDGTRLFPERRAYTVAYDLSEEELDLYEAVTSYVRDEMNRAERLEGNKKGNVGFALTLLQRRLASSPAAIFRSIQRRRERLEERLRKERESRSGMIFESFAEYSVQRSVDLPDNYDELDEELSAEDYERVTDEFVDGASAAKTISEVEAEIETLKSLEEKARRVRTSGNDKKWEELSKILQDTPEMRDRDERRRKIIIFTEHRDTLEYLVDRISSLLATQEAVVTIHGGINRENRRIAQEEFRNNPDVLVLVATDAAGEGVNLQNANLMVNYDLPWNPNRLEQRFGRIHRIGQAEVCHLWNLVAHQTREGGVYKRLLDKLEIESQALGGKVFDILGEALSNTPLQQLLIDAVRYSDDPERRREMMERVENSLNHDYLREILSRQALIDDHMSLEDLYNVRDAMEKAEARKLQPHFIQSFFVEAFARIGGNLREREEKRYEIPHVPSSITERDRRVRSGRIPVVRKYERICFEKNAVRVPGRKTAELMHPGHPLMRALTGHVLDEFRLLLKQGTVMVRPEAGRTDPYVLVTIEHAIRVATTDAPRVISRRLQFVEIDADGNASPAGPAPHLDLRPITDEERGLVAEEIEGSLIGDDIEDRALSEAARSIAPAHFKEVKQRQEVKVGKTLDAIDERLDGEIQYLSGEYARVQSSPSIGTERSAQLENLRRKIDDLRERKRRRTAELERERSVESAAPVVVGAMLVVPEELIDQKKGTPQVITIDPAARRRVEMVAMSAVMEAERVLGHIVADISHEDQGWDVTAKRMSADGKLIEEYRCIEVKGRAKGQPTITVTRNEIMAALNKESQYFLAIVLVDGDTVEGPFYVPEPFSEPPPMDSASVNYELTKLLARAVAPEQTIDRG